MDASQQLILLILACTVGLFLWGRWRHDVVALAALMACVVCGLTPATEAFVGFGHPAVITVAAVLILKQGAADHRRRRSAGTARAAPSAAACCSASAC